MKNLVYTFLVMLLLLPEFVWSQEDRDTVRYTVIYDDPEKANDLYITLIPLVVGAYQNVNIGAEIRVNHNFSNAVEISAFLRKAYFDRMDEVDPEYAQEVTYPVDGTKALTEAGIFGAFYPFNKVLTGEDHVHLQSRLENKQTVAYYMKTETKKLVSIGVRAGLNPFYSLMGGLGQSVPFEATSLTDPNDIDPYLSSSTQTMMYLSMVRFGITSVLKTNYELQVEKYGKRSRHSKFMMFADFIHAYDITFDNVIYFRESLSSQSDQTVTKIYAIEAPLSKQGFMIGGEVHLHSPIALFFGLEGGILPGIKSNSSSRSFGRVKFGMALAGKAY